MFAFMVRTSSQYFEFTLKQLRLVTILWWGLCLPVQAQTPSFSPPSLPALPGVPSVNTPAAPSATTPNAPAASNPTQPKLAALPTVDMPSLSDNGTAATKPAIATPPAPNVLADLPPPAPESSERVTSAPTALVPPPIALVANPVVPPLVPALPAPPGSGAPQINEAKAVGKPVLPPLNFSSNEGDEKPKKPQPKSWQTVLAPTIIPPKTNFNYKRQMLPSTISRTSYGLDNQHLPPAVMREDYARLLANRAAANDLVATRALLNAGADDKDMALAAAQSAGAHDTARLLVARGARSY